MSENFKRKNEIEDFWGNGKSCIQSAEFLFVNYRATPGTTHDYGMGILLTHGLELLFKALLRIKDEKAFKTLMCNRQERHEYEKFYEKCAGHYKTLEDLDLKNLIMNLANKFRKDSVNARYNFIQGTFLAHNTFRILKEKLISPHDKYIAKFLQRRV